MSKMVPYAKEIKITTADDAQSTVMRFRTADGEIDVGLKNKELSKLMALLLAQSEKVAKAEVTKARDSLTEDMAVTASPIQCSAIGIGNGRSDQECCLTVQVGNLRLAFWLGKQTLAGICSDLPRLATDLGKPQRQH